MLSTPLTNAGTVILGPDCLLAVSGAYTQLAGGKYISEIADQPASGQFGVLTATGSATLDGTVEVDLVNGFGPTAGGNFQIMNFASESGNFQFISPHTPAQGDLFAPVVNADSLVAQSIVNASDLAVTDVFVPASGTPGTPANIGYVVKNLSTSATIVSDWVDSVYLSKDAILDPSDVLIERVSHSGTLNPGETYNGQTTVALPAANPGEYHVIVVADERSFVPDTNRSNNMVTAAATLNVTVPALTIGQPVNGTIRNGQDIYYRVDLPPGKTFRIGSTFGTASEMEVYVGYKYVPTRTVFDQSTFPVGQTTGDLVLPSTQAGPYYILLHGRESAAAGNSFSLTVDEIPFGILGLDNAKGSNAGKATVTIHGAGFTPNTTARLVSGPVIRNASRYCSRMPTRSTRRSTSRDSAPARYDLTAIDGVSADTKVGGFTVSTGNPGRLVFHVSAPAITRALSETTVTIDYENTGDTDVTAPLLTLNADWAIMRLPEQDDYVGKSIQFVGINPDGPAGILPAGFKGSITFPALSVSSQGHVGIKYDLQVASDNVPIDWASHKADMRPASIPVGRLGRGIRQLRRPGRQHHGQLPASDCRRRDLPEPTRDSDLRSEPDGVPGVHEGQRGHFGRQSGEHCGCLDAVPGHSINVRTDLQLHDCGPLRTRPARSRVDGQLGHFCHDRRERRTPRFTKTASAASTRVIRTAATAAIMGTSTR